MNRSKKEMVAACLLVAVSVCGCGYLSNDDLFEGRGTVTGRLTVGDEPASDALVFVLGQPDLTTTTDEEGRFELKVAAGRERQLVAMWGGWGRRVSFDLAGGGSVEVGTIRLEALGMVKGKIEYENPQLAEVIVDGTPLVARTDGAGRYGIELPEGSWNLRLRTTGSLEAGPVRAEVRKGAISTIGPVTLVRDPAYSCNQGETVTERYLQGGGGQVDMLLVVDQSGSMIGEQTTLANSFRSMAYALNKARVDFHIAVITPGIESDGCPRCYPSGWPASCINETGESGRFQDLLGHFNGDIDNPAFDFVRDESCRIVTANNIDCLYDPQTGRGTAVVGTEGCGYERPFAAIRLALGNELLSGYNSGFLREHSRLVVFIVSDEEDCGEVGDVPELTQAGGFICYYASKGIDPDGRTVEPTTGEPYALTPVKAYADFLRSLRPEGPGLLRFAAVVGIEDPLNPETTGIEYVFDEKINRYDVKPVCTVPSCFADPEDPWAYGCYVSPGPRYVELAGLLDGVVDTLCQEDFSATLLRAAGIATGVRRDFELRRDPLDQGGIEVRVNGQEQQGWFLIPNRRIVRFEEQATPPAFSKVEITYPAACP